MLHDPFAALAAVHAVRRTDPGYPWPGNEYERLDGLEISEEAKRTFSEMLPAVADCAPAPLFWHIFKPLSKIESGEQAEAVRRIMQSASITGSLPDPTSVRDLLRGLPRAKKAHIPPVTIDGIGPGPDGASAVLDVPNHTLELTCHCSRRWHVDTRSMAARVASEIGGITLLSGDYGKPVFLLNGKEAGYMDIETKAVVYYSRVGTKGRPTLLVTQKPMPDDALAEIRSVFEKFYAA